MGAIKIYPMSIFLDDGSIERIKEELKKMIKYFENNCDENNITKSSISDNMVYRQK